MPMKGLHPSPTAVTTMPVWSWPPPGQSQGGVMRKLVLVARPPRQHSEYTAQAPSGGSLTFSNEVSLPPHSLVAGLLVECGGSLRSTSVGDAGAAVRKPGHRCTQMELRREFGGESQSKALHLHRLVTRAREAGDTTRS